MNPKSLSAEMQAVLQMLDSHLGAMPVHQLHTQLYDATAHPNRRAFDASLSRTIHRLEQRGLITRDGGTIVMTQLGRWAIHPEEFQAALDQIGQSAREAVERAFAECPELQKANREAVESEARWEQIFRSNGWR